MQRLRAEQRAGVMGAVLVLHLAAILALLTTRMVGSRAADDQPALALFEVAATPPPAPVPVPPTTPADTSAEPAPVGPQLDQRTPAPDPIAPRVVAAPPPPASIAVEAIVRLPLPVAAPAAPVSGSGVAGIGSGRSGTDGDGLGGGGTGGAGTGGAGAGVATRFRAARWIRRPMQKHWDQVWPRMPDVATGRPRRMSGQALLACDVLPSGVPHDCDVLVEEPKDRGIGKAAAALMANALIRPVLEDGQPAGLPVLIPVNFVAKGTRKSAPRPVPASP